MSAVVLLWGESPFLLRDAALEILGDVRAEEVAGDDWRPGLTADLSTPSLLGERRALLVSAAQELPEEAVSEVARYAAAPNPEAVLVLTAAVSARAKGPPARLNRPLKDAAEVRRVAVERRDLPGWVEARAARRGLRATRGGAGALIETLGEDPAVLDQALEQLSTAFPDEGLSPRSVAAQFRGLGDRRIWELCDAAFGRDAPAALRALMAMLAAREQPLAILGGIAARLRDLIRVRSLPSGMPPGEVARAAGLRFDWQARRYREQASRYSEEELGRLHAAVAEADRLLKLGGAGEVVLPAVVHRIAAAPARAESHS